MTPFYQEACKRIIAFFRYLPPVLRSTLLLLLLVLSNRQFIHADTGIVVYGSKGTDQRRTDSGHISLIVTDLCASGIDQVRRCDSGEVPGVIVTAYANLASDYNKAIFVLPLLDHLVATHDPGKIPVLSSGSSLRAAQITYWREHLRKYFPPMRQGRYTELRADLDRFDAGRTMRRFLTMEFIGTLIAGHKHQDATEPIALIDPETKELIPDGRWREAVGAEHLRSAVVITAPASLAQELRLVAYLSNPPFNAFNAMTANCSDFVERALLTVYGDSGLRFRKRQLDLADAWITSPLFIATGFLSYLKSNDVPTRVNFIPITAGTRRSHFSVHSISRGALVPDPAQGKLAFSLKVFFNYLNPLLGVTSFTVDQLSRLSDLPGLIHDCSSGDLLTVGTGGQACAGLETDTRDRVRVFGTSSCWRKKQDAFLAMTSQAMEAGLLETQSKQLMLRLGQPYLLARLYEHPMTDRSLTQPLLIGMGACRGTECISMPTYSDASSQSVSETADLQDEEAIPSRPDIRLMAESSEPLVKQIALKLMTSVINFDLSSEPGDRRSVQTFDQDWRLLVRVAEANKLTVPAEAASESLESCSCNSFDTGAESKDALQVARGFGHTVARVEREFVYGPAR